MEELVSQLYKEEERVDFVLNLIKKPFPKKHAEFLVNFLEQRGMFHEAAGVAEKAGMIDRAIQIYEKGGYFEDAARVAEN